MAIATGYGEYRSPGRKLDEMLAARDALFSLTDVEDRTNHAGQARRAVVEVLGQTARTVR
jgi:hypothetical protein